MIHKKTAIKAILKDALEVIEEEAVCECGGEVGFMCHNCGVKSEIRHIIWVLKKEEENKR